MSSEIVASQLTYKEVKNSNNNNNCKTNYNNNNINNNNNYNNIEKCEISHKVSLENSDDIDLLIGDRPVSDLKINNDNSSYSEVLDSYNQSLGFQGSTEGDLEQVDREADHLYFSNTKLEFPFNSEHQDNKILKAGQDENAEHPYSDKNYHLLGHYSENLSYRCFISVKTMMESLQIVRILKNVSRPLILKYKNDIDSFKQNVLIEKLISLIIACFLIMVSLAILVSPLVGNFFTTGLVVVVSFVAVTNWSSAQNTPSPAPPTDKVARSSSHSPDEVDSKKEEERIQKDRCIEVYPETVRQRQRTMAPSPSKVDIKNWEPTEDSKKFLPSVKALRNQFENGKSKNDNTLVRTPSDSSSANSLILNSLDTSSGFGSLTSSQANTEQTSEGPKLTPRDPNEPVEPIFSQFREVDEEFKEMMSKPPSTQGWNPQPLLKKLYYVPDAPKMHRREVPFINIEGYLEKLPSGRKKATFWNAWKRRYFVAKDGILFYYQNNQSEKPNMKLPLIGGKIEIMDPSMISVEDGGRESRSAGMLGIDDGKGHYVVVRCPSRQEAERWKEALESHTYDDFTSQYIQPWPRPTNPTLLRDTLVIDIGSCSVRAGVLASQPTLPQVFFPSVVATNRETKAQIWGIEALMPDVRPTSSISFPIRPSHKISKFSVDLNAVSSLLQKTFNDLKVDPKNYNIQLSVPRVLNPHTQAELLKILFDKYGVKSVNMTHQSILALYAYNATSGIIVDIGERLDVVPVIDGYIVDGGVSRVPYGGYRITDHLRQFLFQKNISLINEIDSYIIRMILESICYCAQHYNTEKQRCTMNPENFEKLAPLAEFFSDDPRFDTFRNLSLDFGRFQATEGLFNPDAWGLDHPGLHKLVHKAIQECSMDIRKELSRSIFLVGGVSQLPGIVDRLTVEIDNLTPPAIRPKVHASPYRYHASFLGACILAESDAFGQSKITKEEWTKQGNSALRKWAL